MKPTRYLTRLGIDAPPIHGITGLETLVQAHALTIPFETLAVAGDPHGTREASGVSLDPADTYEKVIEHSRGGFCFELNGLFGWLLDALDYDVTRAAAMVIADDEPNPTPANHLTHVIELDRRYVVDVGMGCPRPRGPVSLDGTVRTEATGVAWRVVDSDRPDADYLLQYRPPDSSWTDRFVFTDRHRPRSYFAASCEYLATAPESAFTDEPVVALSTPEGYQQLHPDRFVEVTDGNRNERTVTAAEWYDLLTNTFGVAYPQDGPNGT